MNIKQAKEEIARTVRAYLAKDEFGDYRIPCVRQRPVLLMGPPGIGKTQIMEQIADELHIGLVAYTITHHTRQSALGLPFIEHSTFGGRQYAVTEYTMSEILASVYRQMERTGVREGILFLDEINCISETLAPMMLQFLQCKTFGNQRLPDGWIIAAAGNPPEYNKSVREFDVVTLDRVKRIDVEQNYEVWREYALRRGVHGAILAYLDIKKDDFYRIEAAAEGVQFVTARGWEDLSEMLYAYEALGVAPDAALVGQYVQLPRIAKDFANYLVLYDKYRRVWRVDELLAGRWDALRASEFAAAPFDEKLSVLGLLLARLGESARAARRADALAVGLHARLARVKTAEDGVQAALRRELDDVNAAVAARTEAGAADREAMRALRAEAAALEGYLALLAEERPADAFAAVKAAFGGVVDARAEAAQRAGGELEHAFAFLEQAVGEGQEMVMFAAQLTADAHISWLIETFGCEAYFRHNKALLFDDARASLLSAIEQRRRADAPAAPQN